MDTPCPGQIAGCPGTDWLAGRLDDAHEILGDQMRAGEVLADRFEIERLAGSGGMGTVYRARDRQSGEPVAVKLLSRGDEDRFLREGRVLAELNHPAIVRYVAHGEPGTGEPYLAMEWLEGEDLAARLARKPLSTAESLALVVRAAQALSAAHSCNVVHRDIKPGNLFLVGGDPAKLKVVDFGLAHLDHASHAATATGMLLGTPGYMAPEQASGERVDARTDVFALGCVLFECLAGRPVFVAPNARALLTKILLEDPPTLRDVAPDVPPALDRMVTRMLQKRPELRYGNAGAVAKALDALVRGEPDTPSAAVEAPVERMWDERRIASVIMAATPRPQPSFGETSAAQAEDPHRSLLETTAERYGAKLAWVRDGSVVATVNARGTAVDQAVTTARLALALRKVLPKADVVVATGRADVSGRIPMGEVIERATSLLSSQTGAPARACLVDDVTRALVESRFHVVKSATGTAQLVGERHALEVSRPLLGRQTPCVGRDKELALLEATFRECAADGVRRAVLVTATAGYGKTRLAQELLARLRRDAEPCVLVARGDPIGAGGSLGMARQLVRNTPRSPAEPLVEALRKSLLGEEDGEAEVSASVTQGDPRAVLERIRQGFARWIEVAVAGRPGLFVLDDLHWGDPETASLFADAFRAQDGAPCMLLALARPEGLERFSTLRAVAQEVRLEPLTRRASERLVTAILGDSPVEAARRIVERAEGNAFYLEELIRSFGEGRGEAPSETVLALAQARVEALDPHSRRLLRAASVFGDRFTVQSVAALVGDTGDEAGVEHEMEELVRNEILAVAPPAAYAFRHAIVRDAVYGMITEADRAAAHCLAGSWLETRGGHEPVVLAEHYERGAEIEKAVLWLTRAAQAALHRGNFEAASSLAKRGLSHRAEHDALLSTLWTVSMYMSEWKQLGELVEKDLPLLGVDNPRRFLGEAGLTNVAFGTPRGDLAMERALAHLPTIATAEIGGGVHLLLVALAWRGRGADAERVLEHFQSLARDEASVDPKFVAWLLGNTCHPVSLYVTNDLGKARASVDDALRRFDDMKDFMGSSFALHALAQAQLLAGQFVDAEATARKYLERPVSKELSTMWLAAARLGQGAAEEALRLLQSIDGTGSVLNQSRARIVKCEALVALGCLEEARYAAEELLGANTHAPMFTVGALAVLANIAMRQDKPVAAVEYCERGVGLCTRHPRNPSFESTLRLVQARALLATGPRDRAKAALRDTRDRLLRIRATLHNDESREAYTRAIPANAETMALAAEVLGG